MQCLTDMGAGVYSVAYPQPTEIFSCVHVLAQPSDVTVHAWALTVQQGSEIAMAIAILWAIAAAFRVVISLLKSNEGNQNETN